MENLFKNHLLPNEKILWIGQPERKVIFTYSDILLIPFSLITGGLIVFAGAILLLVKQLFGILAVIMGLYFIFGRFIYKDLREKNIYYAVTDKRVLILSTLWSKNLETAYIDTIPAINKSVRADGIGTLRFGDLSSLASWYGSARLDFLTHASAYFRIKDVPTFYDIENANRVYQIVSDLRNKHA